jgi:colanic acid/amylovoran biosynthesis glycosyltransferase
MRQKQREMLRTATEISVLQRCAVSSNGRGPIKYRDHLGKHRKMKRKGRKMPDPLHPDQHGTQSPDALPSLAYLVSTYPTLSMIFVLREVLALRELGFRIETASINPPDRALDALTTVEAAEAKRTYCVKRHGAAGAVKAHLQVILGNFGGYARGLALAFRLAGLDLRRLFFNLMYLTEALMVGQWMRRARLRHLHVHLASQAASVGLFVHEVFGFGYSLTVHGPDEFYDAERHYLPQKIAMADFICCISSFARSQLMKLSPYVHWNKLVVSPLGVDSDLFAPPSASSEPDPASDSTPSSAFGPFEILCVGRLTPAKGQHILIDAVEQLALEGRPVRLHLVGNGPDEPFLRAHAARTAHPECVIFEGAINQDRIRDFYAAADAFCLPSFAEGLPVVLMEAMSMKIPCVSTHVAGIPELIRPGQDGLLVAPSDLGALAEALRQLMNDAALRQRLGRSGRARVVELYNLRNNVKKLAAIFADRVKN